MRAKARSYGGEKRQRQRQETRSKLLNVSLRLFVHRGYDGTSVRDIARDAGVAESLLFHYFPTKLAILEELTMTAKSGVASVVEHIKNAQEPLAAFRAIAEMILGSLKVEHYKNLYLLANQVFSFDSMPISVKKALVASQPIDASVPLVLLGQKKGELRKGDPQALSVAFWGAIQGIAEVLAWNPKASVPDAASVIRILEA